MIFLKRLAGHLFWPFECFCSEKCASACAQFSGEAAVGRSLFFVFEDERLKA